MAVLVVVGLMNLVWMVAVALIFLAEKNWRHAVGLTRVVGVGLLALGLTVIVHPSLLPTVSGVGNEPAVMSDHMNHMG
jgi:predicted metal-binding membrane protein